METERSMETEYTTRKDNLTLERVSLLVLVVCFLVLVCLLEFKPF
jgi:hypothetical protein